LHRTIRVGTAMAHLRPNCPHLLAGIDLLIADERTLRLIDLKTARSR